MMIEKERIQSMLDRFMEGETTEQEEKDLKDFFCHTDIIPEQWEEYSILFRGLNNYKAQSKKKPIAWKAWASVAASVVILFGVGLTISNHEDATRMDSPQMAYTPSTIHKEVKTTEANTQTATGETSTPNKAEEHATSQATSPELYAAQEAHDMQAQEDAKVQAEAESMPEFIQYAMDDDFGENEFINNDLASVKSEINNVRSAMTAMNAELLYQE